MRFFAVPFLVAVFVAPGLRAQDPFDNGSPDKDKRADRLALHQLDFGPLLQEAGKRQLGLSESELRELVLSNFRFIFFSKLNVRNFLVTPDPKQVMDQVVFLFQLNGQLEEMIREGRKLVVSHKAGSEREQLVRDIGLAARRIGRLFREYFLDLHHHAYRLTFRTFETKEIQFVHYLIQLDRINRLLGQELEHYFFNPAPGAVDLNEYDDYSIAILTNSILKLSTLTEKRLRQ